MSAPFTWPLSDEARGNVQGLLDQLVEVGEAVGESDVKVDLRQRGMSLHFRFDNEVDLLTVCRRYSEQIIQSPVKLAAACVQLLAADDALKARLDEERQAKTESAS